MSENVWMMISNTVRLAFFVALAIAFDKWWLVLFVAIF